jgi:hypothetical protein
MFEIPEAIECIQKNKYGMVRLLKSDCSDDSARAREYRKIEVHFYRSLKTQFNYRVQEVNMVINPRLMRTYEEKKKKMNPTGEVTVYHATTMDANIIDSICFNGFLLPGTASKGKVVQSTDEGWYGKGLYFSPFPDYCEYYLKSKMKLLGGGSKGGILVLSKVLKGKQYRCQDHKERKGQRKLLIVKVS